MDIDRTADLLRERDGLHRTLGMEFLSTPEADTCAARMAVSAAACQPFGFLNGGAALALAENLAGAGSMTLCPERICMGVSVTGHHVKAAPMGETVTAKATIVHRGRTLHLWRVEVRDAAGDLVSSVDVENYIISR